MDTPNTDDIKGQAKESLGAATGNDDLKNEGRKDQAEGALKDGAQKVADKASDAVDKVRDKF